MEETDLPAPSPNGGRSRNATSLAEWMVALGSLLAGVGAFLAALR